MKQLILACASAIAVLGLVACSDTDETTTQAVPQKVQPMEQQQAPDATPPARVEPAPSPTVTPPAGTSSQ